MVDALGPSARALDGRMAGKRAKVELGPEGNEEECRVCHGGGQLVLCDKVRMHSRAYHHLTTCLLLVRTPCAHSNLHNGGGGERAGSGGGGGTSLSQ